MWSFFQAYTCKDSVLDCQLTFRRVYVPVSILWSCVVSNRLHPLETYYSHILQTGGNESGRS